MATLTETGVRVVVELARDGSFQACYVTGSSIDAAGNTLRVSEKADVTAALSAEQVSAALTLINAAEAYLKSKWSIS